MLYEEMRPKTFDEVIGNTHITQNLQSSVNLNTVPQSIIFTGRYGTGKTTLAKLLAKAMDGEIVEHDCGSQGDIDTIKDVIRNAEFGSLMFDRKVIILDEVHKLSIAAQTTLLAPVEFPRKGVFWILCTSEPDKLLPALKSRALMYTLDPVGKAEFRVAVSRLLKRRKITLEGDKDSWGKIISSSDGSFRKFYSIMEAVYGTADENNAVSVNSLESVLGLKGSEEEIEVTNLIEAFKSKNYSKLITAIDVLKKEKGDAGAYGALLGLYNYMRKVAVQQPTHIPFLVNASQYLMIKEVSWMTVEHVLMKSLL